jgi:hypothetical protein
VPLQSSSMLLHVTSLAAGVPGVQLFMTVPLTQDVEPVEAQAPTPHEVDWLT